MKIWLASADLKVLEEFLPTGVFCRRHYQSEGGDRAKQPPLDFFREVCRIAAAAYYQLRDASATEMLVEADRFLAVDPKKMKIKVPATLAGFQVIRTLTDRGLEVMATAVPTATWLIFALALSAFILFLVRPLSVLPVWVDPSIHA
jgi:transaldolase